LDNLLDIENLNFAYGNGNFSLKNINLSVERKDFISIIGRNGSGKSTLVKIISRIFKGYEGSVKLKGKNIKEIPLKEFSRFVSYLPQTGILPSEEISVFDLLLYARYPYKNFSSFFFSEIDKKVVEESIKITGTESFKEKYFYNLSGGERQKILITLALVQLDVTSDLGGKILIIDEPLTYLDVHYQLEIFSILNKLNRERGLTILVITHDLNLALKYTAKSVLIEAGEIYKSGASKDIITEEILKKHFLINSKIVNFEDEYHINYKTL
jgi:iron complex transport system ATP-binding protein